jgi:hypothetical protein
MATMVSSRFMSGGEWKLWIVSHGHCSEYPRLPETVSVIYTYGLP